MKNWPQTILRGLRARGQIDSRFPSSTQQSTLIGWPSELAQTEPNLCEKLYITAKFCLISWYDGQLPTHRKNKSLNPGRQVLEKTDRIFGQN